MTDPRTIRIKWSAVITFDADVAHFPDVDALADALGQTVARQMSEDGYMHPGSKITISHATKRGSRE